MTIISQVREALLEIAGDLDAQVGVPAPQSMWGKETMAVARRYRALAASLDGMVLVPREPTKQMREVGGRAFLEGRDTTATTEQQDAANIYRAMLTAVEAK